MFIKNIINYFKSDTSEENTSEVDIVDTTGLPFKKEYLFDILTRYDFLKRQLERKGISSTTCIDGFTNVDYNNFHFYMDKTQDYHTDFKEILTLELKLVDDCFEKDLILYRDSPYTKDINVYKYRDGSWTNELINTISEIEDEIITMQELIQQRDAQLLAERQVEQDMIEAHYYNKYEGKKAISSHELLLDAEKLIHQAIDKLHEQEAFDLMDKAITKIHKAYWIGHSEICLNKTRQ